MQYLVPRIYSGQCEALLNLYGNSSRVHGVVRCPLTGSVAEGAAHCAGVLSCQELLSATSNDEARAPDHWGQADRHTAPTRPSNAISTRRLS